MKARRTVHQDAIIPMPTGEVQKYSEEVLGIVAKPSDFLPRVQLMIAASEKCKKNEFPINHYALVSGQVFVDLGTQIDIVPICWRPKAMQISDDEIVTYFDHASPEFKEIMAKSEEPNSGCMFGPEYLVWVPNAKEKLATFFFGSKSSRREGRVLADKLNQPVTMKSKLIETKKFSWFVPIATGCSTPIEPPNEEWTVRLTAEIDKFNNQKGSQREKVDESVDVAGARER